MKEDFHPVEYEYVGPAEIKELVRYGTGFRIESAEDLEGFLTSRDRDELSEPFTFIVDPSGVLRLAPRRSEHVACADGGPVLAAGEIGFSRTAKDGRWEATFVSNQSTGYCPAVESWVAVERSLDRAGIDHGSGYTHRIVFRRCPSCRNWNTVKDSYFVCLFCDSDLPVQ
ncbi:hypothetical protein GCM10023080_072550 [Streptomyces pseudoechinosporeus]